MNEQFLYNRPTFPAQLNMEHHLTRGLVGCWVLNENSPNSGRAWDSSLYKNHGLVTGAKGYWQGRTFDGSNDDINCGSNIVLNPTEAITIEIWLKLDTTIANQPLDFPNVCEKGDGTGAERAYVIYINRGGGTLVFQINNQTAVSISVSGWVVNEWHHIMATYNRVNELLYIDGGTPTSQALTTAIPVKAFYFGIGRAYPIQGIVGVVRIWNEALSAGEGQQLYLEPYAMFL